MAGLQRDESVLGQLQSKAQGELIDAIDRLRSRGFEHELALPQLIVCGDQSSGKSSVLEAISHVQFPRLETRCTRFATELKLRTTLEIEQPTVTLQPAQNRSRDEKLSLQQFKPPNEFNHPEDLSSVIEAASKELERLGPKRRIYEDKLIVTIRRPDLPNLTLIDLPGLFHVTTNDNEDQANDAHDEPDNDEGAMDIRRVHTLVKSYMKNESSIVLAVVAANNNFDNQKVIRLVKQFDNGGHRSLGVITKPDRVEPGEAAEGVRLARNFRTHLELGWHVLKNRASDDKDASPDQRDNLEAKFFSEDPHWNVLPQGDRGADALRKKLADILLHAISRSLPSLSKEIELKISTYTTDLEKLGEPLLKEREQREELRKISLRLNKLVDASTHGNYMDSSFFSSFNSKRENARRLRARLRDILDEFAVDMTKKGALYSAVPTEPDSNPDQATPWSFDAAERRLNIHETPESVPMEALLLAIWKEVRASRGCELDGLIPPSVIARIFRFQSAKWELIAKRYVDRCCQAARDFYEQAVLHTAPLHIAKAVISNVTHPKMESIAEKLEAKRTELLRPYRSNYLVTTTRMELSSQDQDDDKTTPMQVHRYVEAYYHIAQRTFTENIATLVIENCLIHDLCSIFTFETVTELDNFEIADLTREPHNVAAKRETYRDKLETLRSVQRLCNRHASRFGDEQQTETQADEMDIDTITAELSEITVAPKASKPPNQTNFAKSADILFSKATGHLPSPPNSRAASPSKSPSPGTSKVRRKNREPRAPLNNLHSDESGEQLGWRGKVAGNKAKQPTVENDEEEL